MRSLVGLVAPQLDALRETITGPELDASTPTAHAVYGELVWLANGTLYTYGTRLDKKPLGIGPVTPKLFAYEQSYHPQIGIWDGDKLAMWKLEDGTHYEIDHVTDVDRFEFAGKRVLVLDHQHTLTNLGYRGPTKLANVTAFDIAFWGAKTAIAKDDKVIVVDNLDHQPTWERPAHAITSILWDADGKQFAASSSDGTCTVFALAMGSTPVTFRGRALGFNLTGKTIVVGNGTSASYYVLSTHTKLQTFDGGDAPIDDASVFGDYIITRSGSTLRYWTTVYGSNNAAKTDGTNDVVTKDGTVTVIDKKLGKPIAISTGPIADWNPYTGTPDQFSTLVRDKLPRESSPPAAR
ncbi:MAG: hypothetical protein QM831_00815 [Kofleriaceae bacterium]